MTITPISPVDREKLVPTSASILINFTASPTRADVNGLTVYSSGLFQAGWTGSLLNRLGGGKRLVLTSPSAFSLGETVEVFVEEQGGDSLLYRFQTGTTQATSTDNVSAPVVAVTPAGQYLGYVKDNGSLYVRFTDPLSPEIKLISATVVDVGYDPNLNKVIVFFINNGKVYATTADPGDGPNSIVPPGEAETNLKAVAFPFESASVTATAGASPYQDVGTANFFPVKVATFDERTVSAFGGAGATTPYFGFPRVIAPVVVSLNPRVLRLPRSSETPETSLAVGFFLFKTNAAYTGGRFTEFIPLPVGASYAEYTDPEASPSAVYAAICVYRQGQTTATVQTDISSTDLPVPLIYGADLLNASARGGSGEAGSFSVIALFLPVKTAVPTEAFSVSAFGGASAYQYFGR